MIYGIWHSLAVFFICWYALAAHRSANAAGAPGDLAAAGTAVFISLILTVTLKLSIRTRNWNWITWVTYGLSLAALLPFILVLGILGEGGRIEGVADMVGIAAQLFNFPSFWLAAVVLAPGMSLLPDLAIVGFMRYFRPTLAVLLQVRGAGGWGSLGGGVAWGVVSALVGGSGLSKGQSINSLRLNPLAKLEWQTEPMQHTHAHARTHPHTHTRAHSPSTPCQETEVLHRLHDAAARAENGHGDPYGGALPGMAALLPGGSPTAQQRPAAFWGPPGWRQQRRRPQQQPREQELSGSFGGAEGGRGGGGGGGGAGWAALPGVVNV